MAKIFEIQGRPHIFTLKDGTTLRLMPRQEIEVEDKNISEGMKIANERGYIYIVPSKEEAITEKKRGDK